jgi:hypothetical protein
MTEITELREFARAVADLEPAMMEVAEFAFNNKDSKTRNSLQNFIRAADERLDDYLRRLDEGDFEEGGTGGGADCGAAREARPLRGDAGGSRTNRRVARYLRSNIGLAGASQRCFRLISN